MQTFVRKSTSQVSITLNDIKTILLFLYTLTSLYQEKACRYNLRADARTRVYIYIYIYIYTHTYMYIYIYIYRDRCICVCSPACAQDLHFGGGAEGLRRLPRLPAHGSEGGGGTSELPRSARARRTSAAALEPKDQEQGKIRRVFRVTEHNAQQALPLQGCACLGCHLCASSALKWTRETPGRIALALPR